MQGPERSGLDLYFMATENDAPPFVATLLFRPYFYAVPTMGGGTATMEHEWLSNAAAVTTSSTAAAETEVFLAVVSSRLRTAYEPMGLAAVETVYRQDLDRSNHLSPSLQRQGPAILKLSFDTTAQLSEVRHALQATISQNHPRHHGSNTTSNHTAATMTHTDDPLRCLTELREYDVPYAVRVCIDLDIRAGSWYTVHWDPPEWLAPSPILPSSSGHPEDSSLSSTTTLATATMDTGGVRLMDPDRESKAEPVVLAFDIECTKAPLKFPRADVDEIFMISYMVSSKDGTQPPQGYLIVSRSVVSANVHDFEYTPKPNYPGPFHIFNEVDEKALLNRFFAEFRRHCPQIVVTYNGDFFDFPFVDARAQHYGMDLFREIGVSSTNLPSNGGDNNNNNNNSSNFNNKNQNNVGGYRGRWTVHLDAFHWVQRDSYLPQGAQGLKAVTKYKLGYDPVEVDPEDMVRFAHEKPVHMATYSVSDAVATYYLYEQYVHLFIFSLSTLIPMGPEDVLGKGSGTLCEALLMVQACRKGILCPNKQTEALTQFHNGHLLEAETYIGGKVECLESGVFRSDLLYDFDLQPKGFQELMDNLDRDLTFAIEVEGGKSRSEISNYDEVSVLEMEHESIFKSAHS